MQLRSFKRTTIITLALLALGFPSLVDAGESDDAPLHVEAKLIWGTNDKTSPDPSHKKLNSSLARKLRKTFKWENYFEVTRKTVDVSKGKPESLKMSEECTVVLRNLGDSRIKVELYGKGKLAQTKECSIADKDLVIGGDDENNTAWFVVVRQPEADSP